MNTPADTKNNKPPILKKLTLAIAANTLIFAGYSHAAPTGGVVVDGGGSITQTGTDTRVDQSTQRLSLQWDTFNIAADERVQFVQPSSTSTALNRILDNDGSRILGQIDANGHVILMNPNGILFGESATVNVGGLVASGLNINSEDFMNGDLAFAGIADTAGTVVNRGIINAATGGNVALLGKTVANHGLISANLGHVALASGSEAVVTFDDQGLIGVRIDKETLASEVGSAGAVNNAGTLEAKGGKILLNASVSADLFSAAVNRGEMGSGTEAVVHSDGSFTLGAGHKVVNTGTADASTDETSPDSAGLVIVAGSEIDHQGAVLANAQGDNDAGQIYLEADEQIALGASSTIEASNPTSTSGKISLRALDTVADAGAKLTTSGNTLVVAYETLATPQIETNHLFIQSLDQVTQSGEITATGNAHLQLMLEANVHLTNAANDFNSLSIDSTYTANTTVVDKNDIELGDLKITDSTLDVQASGAGATISQRSGSHIEVDSSKLALTADNVVLGENASIDLRYGFIDINFTQHVNTNHAITLSEDNGIFPNTVHIKGVGELSGGVTLSGNRAAAVNLEATIDDNAETLRIGSMVGDNASLDGLYKISQTGPIHLTDTLNWNAYETTLTHSDNDIRALEGKGSIAFGTLTYVDKNDIVIGMMDVADENNVNITSMGENGKIEQAPNTLLKSDFIALNAANIELGANGSSEVAAGMVLEIDFGNELHINGTFNVGAGWYAPVLRITGNENNNRFVLGEHASNSSFARDDLLAVIDINLGEGNDSATFNSEFLLGDTTDWGKNVIDMGPGMDRVYVNKSMHIPIALGTGRDILRIWDFNTYFSVSDFNYREDRFSVHRPGWR